MPLHVIQHFLRKFRIRRTRYVQAPEFTEIEGDFRCVEADLIFLRCLQNIELAKLYGRIVRKPWKLVSSRRLRVLRLRGWSPSNVASENKIYICMSIMEQYSFKIIRSWRIWAWQIFSVVTFRDIKRSKEWKLDFEMVQMMFCLIICFFFLIFLWD